MDALEYLKHKGKIKDSPPFMYVPSYLEKLYYKCASLMEPLTKPCQREMADNYIIIAADKINRDCYQELPIDDGVYFEAIIKMAENINRG